MHPRQSHARRALRLFSPLLLIAILVATFIIGVFFSARTALAASTSRVDVMLLNSEIGPSSLRFLTRAISTAETDGARALIIEVDTPGGDITSMKSMTEAELNSTVPIITYVYPTGSHAASAGALVTLAAPIAAMAPVTQIGASSPIDSTGADIGSTLKAKIESDMVALITGMQKRFHRNYDLAALMVTKAASYDDTTAFNDHIVNLQATNLNNLLTQVDGQTVLLGNGHEVTLQTAGADVQTLQPYVVDTLYGLLLDPNVVFLLFIIAMIGIYLEISHPGAILPGTAGGIALLLFLFAVGSLSPNWAGMGLMLLAFVLLVLDVRLPTHGVLTVGAIISLIFGSLLFFNSGGPYSGPQVNPLVVYTMAGLIGLISFTLIALVVRAQRRPVTTGPEGMIGAKAIALTPLFPEGRVRYGGEDWAAVLDDATTSVDEGAEVQIRAVEGLRLHVIPVRPPQPVIDVETYSHSSLE